MKQLIALLLLLVTLVYSQQQCSYQKLVDAETQFNTLLSSMNSTDRLFPVMMQMQATFETNVKPCLDKIPSLVERIEKRKVTIQGARCFLPKDDPDWTSDPCCNVDLNQCCKFGPRKAIVPDPVFKSTLLCNDVNKARGLIRAFVRNFMDAIVEQPIVNDMAELGSAMGCISRVVYGGNPCQADGDCESNNCNPFLKICLPSYGGVNWLAVGRCVMKVQIAKFFFFRRYKLSATAKDTDLETKLREDFEVSVCVSTDTGAMAQASDEASCSSASTRCNLNGDANCTTGNFCSVNSTCRFGFCPGIANPLGLTVDKTLCEQSVCKFTFAAGISVAAFIPSQLCSKQGSCDIGKCDGTSLSSQNDCESYQTCAGHFGRCGYCMRSGVTKSTCPLGCNWEPSYSMCVCKIQNEALCTAAGHTWMPPVTAAQCAEYKLCKMPDGNFAPLGSTDCTSCGGTLVPRFTVKSGIWSSGGAMVTDTFWGPRTLIPVNRWVKRLNDTEVREVLIDLLKDVLVDRLKSFLRAKFLLSIGFMKALACSCGDSKGTACFANPIQTPVADITVIPGVNGTIDTNGATVIIKNTSLDASKTTTTTIQVNMVQNVDAASSSPSFTRHATQSNSGNNVMSGSVVVGQIMSTSGVSLSAKLDGAVTICITLDGGLLSTAPSTYTKAAVAKQVSGTFILQSNSAYRNNANQICADVTDTDTYYAALVTTNPSPTQSPTPTQSKKPTPSTAASMFASNNPITLFGTTLLLAFLLMLL